jgi:hypothetical protein
MKFKIFFALFFITTFSFAQLTAKSGGRVFDTYGKKMERREIRNRLAEVPEALALYNSGRTKKRVGNILLYSGIGIGFGGFAAGYVGDSNVVNPATIGGIVIAIVAIPIKSGYSKKIRDAVDLYNKPPGNHSENTFDDIDICANQNGLGIRLTF